MDWYYHCGNDEREKNRLPKASAFYNLVIVKFCCAVQNCAHSDCSHKFVHSHIFHRSRYASCWKAIWTKTDFQKSQKKHATQRNSIKAKLIECYIKIALLYGCCLTSSFIYFDLVSLQQQTVNVYFCLSVCLFNGFSRYAVYENTFNLLSPRKFFVWHSIVWLCEHLNC